MTITRWLQRRACPHHQHTATWTYSPLRRGHVKARCSGCGHTRKTH